MKALLAVLALACAVAFVLAGCSAQVRRDTSVAIEHGGPAVKALLEANRETYSAARDALALSMQANGSTREQYLAALAPMSAEFDHRSKTIKDMQPRLIAAAAQLDATRDFDGAVEAARQAQMAWQDTLDVLESGNVLPPVSIPPMVRAVVIELTRVVNLKDAGDADGNRG